MKRIDDAGVPEPGLNRKRVRKSPRIRGRT